MRQALVATATTAMLATSALAAEPFYDSPIPPDPVFQSAPPFSWTGVYLGANAGYAWGDATVNAFGHSDEGDYNGWLGGGQAGVNWEFAAFLLGFEADIQGTGIDHSETSAGLGSVTSDLSWFSTVRARAGVPFDRVLPYLTGGVAFGSNEITATGLGGSASESNTHVGWTIGGGVEVAIDSQWSVKGEYLFVDLGEETYFTDRVPGGVEGAADFHLLRLGVNYRIPLF